MKHIHVTEPVTAKGRAMLGLPPRTCCPDADDVAALRADLAALREALREAMIAMTTTRTTEGCSPFMAGAIDKARAALDRVQGKEAA